MDFLAASCHVYAPANHHSKAAGSVPLHLARCARADNSSCKALLQGRNGGFAYCLEYGFLAASCHVYAPANHHSKAAGNVPLRLARLAKADYSLCGLMDEAPPS